MAVTVDALGTLVWMEPPAPHLREQLRRAAGVEVSEEQAAKAFGDEIAYYLRHHLEGRDPESLSELRDRCAGVVRTSLGLEHVDLARISEALLSSIHFHAFDDARPALEELRARGLRLVAASNWDASLPEVLERTGLAPLLDGVVSSAMVGATKPARRCSARRSSSRVRRRSGRCTSATPWRTTSRARAGWACGRYWSHAKGRDLARMECP